MQAKPVFHRPQYAADLAQQLLKPTALQVQVRTGVFLSGIRRIGKTTFFGKTWYRRWNPWAPW